MHSASKRVLDDAGTIWPWVITHQTSSMLSLRFPGERHGAGGKDSKSLPDTQNKVTPY